MSRRVVITGLGAVTPLGTGVEKFWAGIKENKLGISYIDMFDTERTGVKIAGIVRDFNEEDYYGVEGCFEKKEARHMDTFTKYAVIASHEALTDAGTDLKDLDPYRVGVLVASCIAASSEVNRTGDTICFASIVAISEKSVNSPPVRLE